MKNYVVGKENKRNFILRYDIKDGIIDIHFADGKVSKVPFTKENEEKILKKMNQQVVNSDTAYNNIKSSIIPVTDVCSAFVVILDISALPYVSNPKTTYSVIAFSAAFVSSLLAARATAVRRIKDIEKNKMYLDNRNLFTREKLNENVVADVSEETREFLTSKDVININDVDKLSLKEMKILLNNLRRDENLGLDYKKVKKLEKAHN